MGQNKRFTFVYEGIRYTGEYDRFASAFIIIPVHPIRILRVLGWDTQNPPNPIRFKDETDMHPELANEDINSVDFTAQTMFGTVARPVETPKEVMGQRAIIHQLFEICPIQSAMPFYEEIASHAGKSFTAPELVDMLEEALASDGNPKNHGILLGKFPSFIAALSCNGVGLEAQKIFMTHFLSARRKDDPQWKSL